MGDIRKEDEVLLLSNGFVVASGRVHKLKTGDTCQNVVLGEGRISVLVEQIIDGKCVLPFLTPVATTLAEALDTCVIWGIEDVRRSVDGEPFQIQIPSQSPEINFRSVTFDNGLNRVFPRSAQRVETVSTIAMQSTTFSTGAEVDLLFHGRCVGFGVVYDVQGETVCHEVPIGASKMNVSVIGAFPGAEDVFLPFPHAGAETIGEALNSVVKWDVKDVRFRRLSDEDIPPSASQDQEISASPPERSSDSIFLNGDDVNLFYGGRLVGRGVVFEVLEDRMCHNVPIGVGNISVSVSKAFVGAQDVILPFPHAGADTVGEAINSVIKWPIIDVRRRVLSNEYISPFVDSHHQHNTTPIYSSHGGSTPSKNYKNRLDWNLVQVELLCPTREEVVARGPITVFHELGVVDDEVLGEDHVGVTVSLVICQSYFPHIPEGLPGLVRWPINRVRLIGDGRFLGDILQEEELDSDDSLANVLLLEPGKRHYHSSKRKKVDAEEKRRKELATKAVKRTTEASIDDVKREHCCNMKCCLEMSREAIEDIRLEFHGMSSQGKTSYILSLFHNREKEVIASGRMVLKTRIVCKKAFHFIHGFSHTQFYKYENMFKHGATIGFHGNTGQLKTRGNTLTARAILSSILRQNSEPMPHIVYNGTHGTDRIEYRLPSCFSKTSIYEEVCMKMTIENLPSIVFATFHKIWNEGFENYKVHNNSAFAKCDLCSIFKDKLQRERRKNQRAKIERARAKHLREQMSRRHVYYSNRIMAKLEPHNYLCIIHDKMDQGKTWLPKLVPTPKYLSSTGHPLPIALTGMLTHGRDPGVFAHFSLTGLWPGDADFTVTSLLKCFRDLEDYSGDKSGDISIDNSLNLTRPIFQAIMDPEAFKASYLDPKGILIERFEGRKDVVGSAPSTENPQHGQSPPLDASSSTGFKSLPMHLTLQMDNSAKDNKNQTIMAFCSELVLRGVFKTVTLSFLMVGHTHEDVDALFSRVNMRIKGKEVSTLLALMAEVWESESIRPVPSLVSEVVDYKEYLKSFHVRETVGHSYPVAFLFSMKDNIPIYQYKATVKDLWLPAAGRCIWATNPETNALILPEGEPTQKKMPDLLYKKANEVVPYLRRYTEYLLKSCTDETSATYRERYPLIKYWENIADVLRGEVGRHEEEGRPLPLSTRIWPRTNHGTGYMAHVPSSEASHHSTDPTRDNVEMVNLQNEYADEMEDRDEIFVGHPSEKERERWTPLHDIQDGKFVIVRPEDDWERMNGKWRFWLVKALGQVDPNHPTEEGPKPMFKVEWWRPKHVSHNVLDKARYLKCFSLTQSWERDPGYNLDQDIWQKAPSAMYGWSSKMKPENISRNGLRIPKSVIENVRAYMKRIEEEENMCVSP